MHPLHGDWGQTCIPYKEVGILTHILVTEIGSSPASATQKLDPHLHLLQGGWDPHSHPLHTVHGEWVHTCIRYTDIGATLASASRRLGPHLHPLHGHWVLTHIHYINGEWVRTCICFAKIGATHASATRSLGPHLLLQHKNWIHMHIPYTEIGATKPLRLQEGWDPNSHPHHGDWVHTCIFNSEIDSALTFTTMRLTLH